MKDVEDFTTELFLRMYEEAHGPNDPVVRLRAPIDVFDFVKIIRRQQAEIAQLKAQLGKKP